MTTISSYLSVSTNIDKWRAIAAKKPDVQLETNYYKTHISKITSVDAFLKDRRLLNYALHAFGLGDKMQAIGMMRRVLEQGVDKPNALARTLNDRRILEFAKAFDFIGKGAASLGTRRALVMLSVAMLTTRCDLLRDNRMQASSLPCISVRTRPG